ncbi:DUF4124 domain-containing protein [Pseudoalteromonas sp. GCY]|uniref:DUF4124 domain-containing protein n=1 Tax=Pseudoalteromonas TaxID=53246 RepID=UPI000299F42C|nr:MULTISPECIES: DUF4124 domain-containing protein [Pseudoalteromonas]PHI35960.1 DUF4124 domain-containing protein [Pseudoalteromonas sp. GCY]QQQ68561.1 DUF4124 domain-containing protein [Pseudoalteromonas sp. GCY]WMO14361.1 DUF4124 domain-containing protein [Pseudoalteromonas piscicida]
MKLMMIPLILCVSSSTLAFEVYKCDVDGVITYSDRPCAKDAEKVKVRSNAPSTRPSPDKLVEECLAYVKENRAWKDPDSVQLVSYRKIWTHDSSGARQVLRLEVKAKNSYGAYDGTTHSSCFLNHSGTGLSSVQELL